MMVYPHARLPEELFSFADAVAVALGQPVHITVTDEHLGGSIAFPLFRVDYLYLPRTSQAHQIGTFPEADGVDDARTVRAPGASFLRALPPAVPDTAERQGVRPSTEGYEAAQAPVPDYSDPDGFELMAAPSYIGHLSREFVGQRADRVAREVVQGWRRSSGVPGRRRSAETRAIDRAVARLPRWPGEGDLRQVLAAVSAWRAAEPSDAMRSNAVDRLEWAIESLLHTVVTPRRMVGAVDPYPTNTMDRPLMRYPLRPTGATDGFDPAGGWEAVLDGYFLPPDAPVAHGGTLVELPGVLRISAEGSGGTHVLKVISEPASALAGGSHDGVDRAQVMAAFEDVLTRLAAAPPNAGLAAIFPAPAGYQVADASSGVPVWQDPSGTGTMAVSLHESVQIGGIADFMRQVLDASADTPQQAADGHAALDFADRVAHSFLEWAQSHRGPGSARTNGDWHVVRDAAVLGYSQSAAAARAVQSGSGPGTAAAFAALVLHEELAAVRVGLGPVARAFLADERDRIRQELTDTLVGYAGDEFTDVLDWRLPVRTGRTSDTIGDFLDGLLVDDLLLDSGPYTQAGDVTRGGAGFRGQDLNIPRSVGRRLQAVWLEAPHFAAAVSSPADLAADFFRLGHWSVDMHNTVRSRYGLPRLHVPPRDADTGGDVPAAGGGRPRRSTCRAKTSWSPPSSTIWPRWASPAPRTGRPSWATTTAVCRSVCTPARSRRRRSTSPGGWPPGPGRRLTADWTADWTVGWMPGRRPRCRRTIRRATRRPSTRYARRTRIAGRSSKRTAPPPPSVCPWPSPRPTLSR
ncbi:hypothetical protein VSR01_09610 [Actinacidiphila sp. DG2A-62]|uniref:hypothetical protein n=1 Tax=Actinacidiphila sp. DG2A-62 TaxID=3108821 RepID=UPI002DBAC110|nr:hypothetical protein [Actinacidiphila sp. DG2A-62]MEC3993782.1 hypothetical protein [Actinacidiphila sp. DG2A-62]